MTLEILCAHTGEFCDAPGCIIFGCEARLRATAPVLCRTGHMYNARDPVMVCRICGHKAERPRPRVLAHNECPMCGKHIPDNIGACPQCKKRGRRATHSWWNMHFGKPIDDAIDALHRQRTSRDEQLRWIPKK